MCLLVTVLLSCARKKATLCSYGTDPWMELQNTGEKQHEKGKNSAAGPIHKMAVEPENTHYPHGPKSIFSPNIEHYRIPWPMDYTAKQAPKSAESKQRKCNMTESRKREKEFLKWKRKWRPWQRGRKLGAGFSEKKNERNLKSVPRSFYLKNEREWRTLTNRGRKTLPSSPQNEQKKRKKRKKDLP